MTDDEIRDQAAALTDAARQLLARVFADATELHVRAVSACPDCRVAERDQTGQGVCAGHRDVVDLLAQFDRLAERLAALGLLPDAPGDGGA